VEAALIYLKAVAVGFGCGLLALVIWVLLELLPLFVESAGMRSGGIGAVSVGLVSDSLLLVALLGFVSGFCWTMWRARRRRSAISNSLG
jgi:hypothetical protein